MSSTNVTLQKFLNSGYTVLANETLSSGQLPQHDLTSKIIVTAIPDDPISEYGFIGNSGSSTSNAFPLFVKSMYFDGGVARPFYLPTEREIETTTPEDFYLMATGSVDFRVLYLKLNQ